MEVPFDILDSIFGFLKSHPKSLVACSKAHPTFSQAIEPHLYYHIRLNIPSASGLGADIGYTLGPSNLIELLNETPHIINHFRVLEIGFHGQLEEISLVLPMLSESRLECIILTAPWEDYWWRGLSQSFKTALEICLRLPTLQKLHVSNQDFPLSILNKHVNINCFSLSGSPQEFDYSNDTNPQLIAFSFDGIHRFHSTFFTWAKQHIVNLQSLKCDYSDDKILSALLEVCPDTLSSLDILLASTYGTRYHGFSQQATDGPTPSINLSSLPHLKDFTIRGAVYFEQSPDPVYLPQYYCHITHLPAIVEIFKRAPLIQHLTIDILVCDEDADAVDFYSKLNFPFFAALAESAASFHHIDLYVRGIPDTKIVSLFGEYGGVTEFIERGVLVIHMHKTAPRDSRFVGKSTLYPWPIQEV